MMRKNKLFLENHGSKSPLIKKPDQSMKNDPARWAHRDLNPRPPDYESGALTS